MHHLEVSEMLFGELRQITENVREGSRKEGKPAALVNKMSQGAEVEALFSTLDSYITLTAAGFLVASSTQQTASVPKDSICDCLSEKHGDCTG